MKHARALTKFRKEAAPRRAKQLVKFPTGWTTAKFVYSIAILGKGDAQVGIVSAIGAFSALGMDHLSLVNSTTLTGQSYFSKFILRDT